MATVTPNFNWPVPTSTDLVKDGATAIEALGDSIDASLVDLKGGTTGQVLSKTSNTDMDFTWVAQDDSNAIQNSIVNAKGDLIGASANDTPAILSVGNNGETLVADSSTSTGLRYTAGTVQANPVLNSAMQIAQRGTSIAFNSRAGYGLDRWYVFSNPSATISQQPTGDTTNLPFIQYCMRIQRNSGNTSATPVDISQPFETLNSIAYAGKTVTLSFYARAGANYSPASNALAVRLYSGTGVDQNIYGTYTGGIAAISQTATLTTTWQRFSYTATLNSNVTELQPQFVANYLGTAGANDYYDITGVQLDIGSVALPFRTNAGTIQGETSACQRYYFRNTASQAYSNFSYAMSDNSTTVAVTTMHLPVTMRVAPTSVDFSNIRLTNNSAGFPITAATVSGTFNGSTVAGLSVTVASGIVAGGVYTMQANNNVAGYVGVSAEL